MSSNFTPVPPLTTQGQYVRSIQAGEGISVSTNPLTGVSTVTNLNPPSSAVTTFVGLSDTLNAGEEAIGQSIHYDGSKFVHTPEIQVEPATRVVDIVSDQTINLRSDTADITMQADNGLLSAEGGGVFIRATTGAAQLITATTGSGVEVDQSGLVVVKARGDGQQLELQVDQSATNTASIVLVPSALNSSSVVKIDDTVRSAADYAAVAATNDAAVPNVYQIKSFASEKVTKGGDGDGIPLSFGTTDAQKVSLLHDNHAVLSAEYFKGAEDVKLTALQNLSLTSASTLTLTSTAASIALLSGAAAGDAVRITGVKTAAQYATDIAADDSAVPNVKYVDDAVAAAIDLSAYAKKDGTDVGVVTVGSADNDATLTSAQVASVSAGAGAAVLLKVGGADRLEVSATDIIAASGYTPGTNTSLVTKEYADGFVRKTGDTMIGAGKIVQNAAPTAGDDLTNKTYVDAQISGITPNANAQLINTLPSDPNAFGVQDLTNNTSSAMTMDTNYTVGNFVTGFKKIGTSYAVSTATECYKRIVVRYVVGFDATPENTEPIYVNFALINQALTNTGLSVNAGGSVAFNRTGTTTLEGVRLSFYRAYDDATDTFSQPIFDFTRRMRFIDLDAIEQFAVNTESILGYQVSQLNVVPITLGGKTSLRFQGQINNAPFLDAVLRCVESQNYYDLYFTRTSSSGLAGLGLRFDNAAAWNATTVPVAWKVQNAVANPSQYQYTISNAVNCSFARYDGGTLSPFTQQTVDDGQVYLNISNPLLSNLSFDVTVNNTRHGIVNLVSVVIPIVGNRDYVDNAVLQAIDAKVTDLTTDISGVLPVANGGTNISSYTTGDLVYASGATTLSKLASVTAAAGSAQVLKSTTAGAAPAYGTIPLNDLSDVTITSALTGDMLRLFSGVWENRKPTDGQIKVNSFNTNIGSNNLISFTGLTTEQDVTYRITGQTTTALNQSAFPTTSVPLNYGGVFTALGTVGVDGDFYRLGATAANDRWIQNQVLGQICEYRVEGTYSNKTASNSGRIQIRIYNPLSSFSFEVSVPLAQGTTGDDFGVNLITINDAANLLSPLGTGGGYKIGISSTTSVDVSIQSIVRIDRFYSPRS